MDKGLPSLAEFIPCCSGFNFFVWCVVAHCFVPFLLVMVLSVLLRFSVSGCPFVVLPIRSEMCLSRALYKSDIFLIAGALSERRRFLVVVLFGLWYPVWCDVAHCCVLFSFGHCVVCPCSIFGFWLPLWQLNQKCFNCAFHIP